MPAAQLKPCPSEPVAKSTKSRRYRTKAEHLTYSTFREVLFSEFYAAKATVL